MTSKVHIAVDGPGNPVRFILTPGQVHDGIQAEALVEDLPGEHLLADKAYDSDRFRKIVKEHHLVECFINKIKQFRRIATRYERTVQNFRSVIYLSAAKVWMR